MSNDLDRFAESFQSEGELREKIASLLRRIGKNQGIQITHSSQEYGKDIVFYCPDGFDGWILNACVVKKDKITGSADDNKGARNVFIQAEQALDTPLINSSGEEERVSRVHIISPYDCSQITMRSIAGKLKERSGQVSFLCGQSLLDKFAQFWPEFLIFESSLLGSYVSTMQRALEQNDPLGFLLAQHQITSLGRRSFSSIYVRQSFQKCLRKVALSGVVPDTKFLKKATNERSLNKVLDSLAFASKLVRHPQVWEHPESAQAEAVAAQIEKLRTDLNNEWQRRYSQARRAAQSRGAQLPISDSIQRLFVDLVRGGSQKAIDLARDVLDKFSDRIAQANAFVGQHTDFMSVLYSPEHLNYCRVHEVVHTSPTVFSKNVDGQIDIHLEEDLLDRVHVPLLITAPAGYGKTSFCKWNMLANLNQLATKATTRIPIYVPLHQLANTEYKSWQEAFLRTPEFEDLFQRAVQEGTPIRLYLDGLDEVASTEQQKKLMDFAALIPHSFPNVQIVVTGRDYVSGPWLRWLARVSLAKLDDAQVAQLIANWLGDEPSSIQEFNKQMLKAPILGPLMRIPLLGTLIIAVFKKMRSLPENKIRLYEIFVDLMCGGWDAAKKIGRESEYGYSVKRSVLTRLAGRLHSKGVREATELDVKISVQNTLYSFSDRWRSLLDEILDDGLIIRAGTELAFSHLSFQEFLAANDLHDPKGKRQEKALTEFLSGEDRWREVLSFYVGMSNRPDEMAAWIQNDAASSSTEKASDWADRIEFLLKSVEASSPGWLRASKRRS